MDSRSRSSSASVLPLTFALPRFHSPTRHFSSPSSSSASNFAALPSLSPTRLSLSGGSSSTFAAASSSINFGLDKSASQVRSSGRPISPKGTSTMKPIPCAPPRKTCMCSPTNHPAECEEVGHDKFAGKNRQCGRRMGEKSPRGSHTPLQPPHAKENIFPAPS